jgi:hypothetical protein
MYREKRAVSLVILTLFIYAANIYLDYNSFVLPFPIFDFILVILAVQFAFWNIKDIITFRKWYFLIYFGALLAKLISNPIFWGFFLDEIQMEEFLQTAWMEIFKVGFSALSVLVFFTWSYVEKLKYNLIFPILLANIQFLGSFETTYWFFYLSFALFAIYVLIQKPKNSLSYLPILHGALDLMTLAILSFVH